MKTTIEFDLDLPHESRLFQETMGKFLNTGKVENVSNLEKATKLLRSSIGEKKPMSNKERAQKASNARWEKQRLAKLAKDAKEVPLKDFNTEEETHEHFDGRQIIEGTF